MNATNNSRKNEKNKRPRIKLLEANTTTPRNLVTSTLFYDDWQKLRYFCKREGKIIQVPFHLQDILQLPKHQQAVKNLLDHGFTFQICIF